MGDKVTRDIPFDASPDTLAQALEELKTLEAVGVTRTTSPTTLDDGYTWTVTFYASSLMSQGGDVPLLVGNASGLQRDL
jgi:hypothetical protein